MGFFAKFALIYNYYCKFQQLVYYYFHIREVSVILEDYFKFIFFKVSPLILHYNFKDILFNTCELILNKCIVILYQII